MDFYRNIEIKICCLTQVFISRLSTGAYFLFNSNYKGMHIPKDPMNQTRNNNF